MQLTIKGLKKTFAAPVLKGVDLDIAPGEILGLVGENGAGKSTLVKILSGSLGADDGVVLLDDKPYAPRSPRAARASGVAAAAQELSLIETLDVAQNIWLHELPALAGILDRKRLFAQTRKLLDTCGLVHLDPWAEVGSLPLATRQLLEFAKLTAQAPSLFILDEPTAALSDAQADDVHAALRQEVHKGASALYVSHRLKDVLTLCDRVAVMRDGVILQLAASDSFDVDALIRAMSGKVNAPTARRRAARSSKPLLSAKAVQTAPLPHPISLDLYGGEIVGLAGLAGAGRTEVLEALYGLTPLKAGTVERGRGVRPVKVRSPAQAVSLKMGFVSEDRRRSGIFLGLPVRFSMSIASLNQFAVSGIVQKLRERRAVEAFTDAIAIKPNDPDCDIARLSGGNQQKVLLARWLLSGAEILLLDEPGRGVDVAAKARIYDEIRTLAGKGCAILIVSSELEEIADVADRVLVMSSRRIVEEFRAPFDVNDILSAAFTAHLHDRTAPPAREIGEHP